MAYLEWGDPDNPRVLVCVHGLTRCARDFDDARARDERPLPRRLPGRRRARRFRLARRPDALRQFPQYVADMVTLIARLDVEQVHWVGTSMGGLIGMALAGAAGHAGERSWC